ncbi:hypothetical protein [Streptomyces sp. NBC_00454]|uniref:hypothetical protein n=1 Tax=Streptomyces sp. NBC_00454 TaxID=2975747 RepID=UPI00324E3171
MRTASPKSPEPLGLALKVAAVVLWSLTALSVALVVLLLAVVCLLGAESGKDVTGAWQRPLTVTSGAAGVLALLYFAPGIRRMPRDARLALLGALALPGFLALVVGVM